jgi:hypothetical protein
MPSNRHDKNKRVIIKTEEGRWIGGFVMVDFLAESGYIYVRRTDASSYLKFVYNPEKIRVVGEGEAKCL